MLPQHETIQRCFNMSPYTENGRCVLEHGHPEEKHQSTVLVLDLGTGKVSAETYEWVELRDGRI